MLQTTEYATSYREFMLFYQRNQSNLHEFNRNCWQRKNGYYVSTFFNEYKIRCHIKQREKITRVERVLICFSALAICEKKSFFHWKGILLGKFANVISSRIFFLCTVIITNGSVADIAAYIIGDVPECNVRIMFYVTLGKLFIAKTFLNTNLVKDDTAFNRRRSTLRWKPTDEFRFFFDQPPSLWIMNENVFTINAVIRRLIKELLLFERRTL